MKSHARARKIEKIACSAIAGHKRMPFNWPPVAA
jgi:hypothetical protein